ncbi:hypothetical protein [Aquimarina longa]|uniref:hypothetical protein n=1 Tax=Aquimarina longa TaxID=1080221 RepID=UPI000784A9DF|nr:hypothetical protein [Aquimarina longa]
MKKIKTIGILGMGAVGISIAYILQQLGFEVIAFKRDRVASHQFCDLMHRGKIKIINKTKNINSTGNLDVKITHSLDEIANQSDLILNCCRFPPISRAYQFDESEKDSIRKNNTPIIAFPGKLGSTWLIDSEYTGVGLIAYSPVFATKKVIDQEDPSIVVTILDIKRGIPLAHNDLDTRLFLLSFFNKYFEFNENTPFFIDGGSVLKTALSSPVAAINAAAICDNAKGLFLSQGKPIKETIYALSSEYSRLFQEVFNEQLAIANLLQIKNVPTIQDWLKSRIKENESGDITEMLHHIYKNHAITISGKDRRIVESYNALLYFKSFASTFGQKVEATEQLIKEIDTLKNVLSSFYEYEIDNSLIEESAVMHARDSISKNQKEEKILICN